MNAENFLNQIRPLVNFDWVTAAVDSVSKKMEQDGGHDFGHLFRVLNAADTISKSEQPCDWEVVAFSILFHDVINLPKNSDKRHLASTLSAKYAVEFAQSQNIQKLDQIFHAIQAHSYSSGFTPETTEAKVLCDADRLECTGAIGVARTYYVGGVMGGALFHPSDPWAEDRDWDDKRWATDHFFTKILKTRDLMYTAQGLELATRRATTLWEFLEQLALELGVPIPDQLREEFRPESLS